MYGANGNDRLDGDYGNDELWGEAGSDTIYGSFGNDTLIGGGAPAGTADYLYGGEGNDVYLHNANLGASLIFMTPTIIAQEHRIS
ncbi:hemolysin type calcium-binding protein [Azospirillum brasilense]|nr:hemolysin type calcium-binding protein [Azospirillum brasilense]